MMTLTGTALTFDRLFWAHLPRHYGVRRIKVTRRKIAYEVAHRGVRRDVAIKLNAIGATPLDVETAAREFAEMVIGLMETAGKPRRQGG